MAAARRLWERTGADVDEILAALQRSHSEDAEGGLAVAEESYYDRLSWWRKFRLLMAGPVAVEAWEQDQRLKARLAEERALADELAEAGAEFEGDLSEYCDGPERERLRAALAHHHERREAG